MATAAKIEQMAEAPAIQPTEAVTFEEEFQRLPVSPDWDKPDQPVSVPGQVLLGSVHDGRLRVCSPIRVNFTEEGHHIIAEAVEINEFGFGQNPSEAIIDLQHAIVELYFTLEKEQERLGGDLQNVWERLQKLIRAR
jgi:hypothetical protein